MFLGIFKTVWTTRLWSGLCIKDAKHRSWAGGMGDDDNIQRRPVLSP